MKKNRAEKDRFLGKVKVTEMLDNDSYLVENESGVRIVKRGILI